MLCGGRNVPPNTAPYCLLPTGILEREERSMRKLLRGTVATAALAASASINAASAAAPIYLQGATAPTGGVWVEDGTGLAKGHLWIADHLQGFCRLDPGNNGNTAATLNTASCKLNLDGQPSYAPIPQLAFAADGSAKSVGVARLKLRSGLFSGGQTNFNNALPVADSRCKGNTLGGCRPVATAFV